MKVTFDLVKRQIGIEGDAPELVEVLKLARDIAPKLPEINIVTQISEGPAPPAALPSGPELESPRQNARQLSMREWARRLVFNNNGERIAALGYYATKIESRDACPWYIRQSEKSTEKCL